MRLITAFSYFSMLVGSVTAHGNDKMSRHLVMEGTDVVMIAEAGTTEGPFDEEESDYMDSTDMTLAAYAGSPGITQDRLSVINGIPMDLTLTLLNIDNDDLISGADIFLWHCDALGIYSAVESDMQSETRKDKSGFAARQPPRRMGL